MRKSAIVMDGTNGGKARSSPAGWLKRESDS